MMKSLINILNNTRDRFKIMYLAKVALLLILCRVHDYTRYKVCRSFSDLFYWPGGLCADMAVVLGVFLLGALICWDQGKIFIKLHTES